MPVIAKDCTHPQCSLIRRLAEKKTHTKNIHIIKHSAAVTRHEGSLYTLIERGLQQANEKQGGVYYTVYSLFIKEREIWI